jgi:CDGSH-type Zn-finger protein
LSAVWRRISNTRKGKISTESGVPSGGSQPKTRPLCDGSHKGIGLTPIEFSLTEEKEVALCQCKQTKNQPFCEGTHETL